MPTQGESNCRRWSAGGTVWDPISGLIEQGLERSAPRETEAGGWWPDLGSLRELWEVELQDENSAFQLGASRMRGPVYPNQQQRLSANGGASRYVFRGRAGGCLKMPLAAVVLQSTRWEVSSGWQTAWQRSTTSELYSDPGPEGCSADMYSCAANSSRSLAMVWCSLGWSRWERKARR